MKKIFIISPPYSEKSAGIVALHELCDSLNRNGYDTFLILLIIDGANSKMILDDNEDYFNKNLKRKRFNTINIKSIEELKNEIVIYPEIITGNPLGIKHVARYFLNSEGIISGKKTNQIDTDFIISWDEKFHPKANFILNKYIYSSLIDHGERSNNERTLELTFIGKGSKFQKCFKINNTLLLTTSYPSSKEDYAYLLKNTKYIYMWDNVTSVAIDAILSGATVVLVCDLPISRNEIKSIKGMPFLKGEIIDDEKIQIIQDPDYDFNKAKFIEKIITKNKSWHDNTKLMVENLLNFFHLK
jgi:hypothetical protein